MSRDILLPTNLSEWSEAMHSLNNNEGLAVIWDNIVTSEQAEASLVHGHASPTGISRLDLSILGETFCDALVSAANISTESTDYAISGQYLTAYFHTGRLTPLHRDDHRGGNQPVKIQLVGRHEQTSTFVPLEQKESSQPTTDSRLPGRITTVLTPIPAQYGDLGLHRRSGYLAKDDLASVNGKAHKSGAGTLIAFSAIHNTETGRLAVAHQMETVDNQPRLGAAAYLNRL